MLINSISRTNRRDDLIPPRRHRRSHQRRDIPPSSTTTSGTPAQLLRLHAKNHQPSNRKRKPAIRKPKPKLRARLLARPLAPQTHPAIARAPADLLPEHAADDQAEELQAELLRVEGEEGEEYYGDFHHKENAAEAEDDCVG